MMKSLKSMFPAGQLPSKYLRPLDPTICPDCGGPLHLDPDVQIVIQGPDERERSRYTGSVLFCSGCEYAHEVRWVQA